LAQNPFWHGVHAATYKVLALIGRNFKYRDKWWVIDISGNNLRMIAFIEFRDNRMYVKHICSHAEYDRLTDKYRRKKE
jgi:mRNA interferase HigB